MSNKNPTTYGEALTAHVEMLERVYNNLTALKEMNENPIDTGELFQKVKWNIGHAQEELLKIIVYSDDQLNKKIDLSFIKP